jgi:hypothetical protein
MDPYACCYCGVTKQTQKQIVEHTIQEHPTNEVKLRKCGLSTSTGKCGYRTLNFKIIPSELESLGKKVCVDDHGSAFIILFYNMTLHFLNFTSFVGCSCIVCSTICFCVCLVTPQ